MQERESSNRAKTAAHGCPTTSATLLRDLASDTQHARWGEFVARYRPMMEACLRSHFPSLDADETIQETLIALIRIFPVYHYVPDEKGSFHNYLTGVLRHKALKAVASERRAADRRRALRERAATAATPSAAAPDEADEKAYREAIFEIALQQYLADDAVEPRTKQVFTRLAVNGEKPEAVAASFGIARNAVDQIKSRALTRLRALVKALESVDDAEVEHN